MAVYPITVVTGECRRKMDRVTENGPPLALPMFSWTAEKPLFAILSAVCNTYLDPKIKISKKHYSVICNFRDEHST
jgi:hypothetical protein